MAQELGMAREKSIIIKHLVMLPSCLIRSSFNRTILLSKRKFPIKIRGQEEINEAQVSWMGRNDERVYREVVRVKSVYIFLWTRFTQLLSWRSDEKTEIVPTPLIWNVSSRRETFGIRTLLINIPSRPSAGMLITRRGGCPMLHSVLLPFWV